MVPNPSGLNAHETVASLAEAYAAPARAAECSEPPLNRFCMARQDWQ